LKDTTKYMCLICKNIQVSKNQLNQICNKCKEKQDIITKEFKKKYDKQ